MASDTGAGESDLLPPLPPEMIRKASSDSQLDFEIDFFDGILQHNPNYLDVLRVMGNNLSAKGDYVRGLDIDRRIACLRPTDCVALYNLACSYARLDMIEMGLKSLQKAIESGYDEFDYMMEDQDLESLRKDPRFRELLETDPVA